MDPLSKKGVRRISPRLASILQVFALPRPSRVAGYLIALKHAPLSRRCRSFVRLLKRRVKIAKRILKNTMTWRFVRSHVYLMVPRRRFWLIGKAKILEPFLVGSVGLKFPKSGAQGQRFSRKIFEPRMNSYFPMAWCCRTNRMAVPSSQKSFGKPKLAWKKF